MDIKFKFLILVLVLLNTTLISNARIINLPHEGSLSYTNSFVGNWDMKTIVVDSNCPYVFVGTTTKSKLKIKLTFVPQIKNFILKGLWFGGNWEKSKSFIKILNKKEAITERVTEYKSKDENNWKAILIDHLKLDEDNVIHSESIVIQYKNGIPVGEYKTFSILTKEE